MENVVVAIISMAIILGGTLTLMLGSIPSIDTLSTSWKEMAERSGEIRRTEIAAYSYNIYDEGAQVEITISNDGEVSLGDFNSWDVIVKYDSDTSSYVEWLPYTTSNPPENDRWTVDGIYFGGAPETIEPNILNPGEEMTILVQLDPPVAQQTTNLATISTPNGVDSQIIFERN